MPWVLSNVETSCNRCRTTIAKDAECYRGDLTGQYWCALCGQEIAERQPAVRSTDGPSKLDRTAMQETLQRLMAKAELRKR